MLASGSKDGRASLGRSYTRDLKMIPDVYNWALTTPIDKITEFVRRSKKMPLYVIGSGGSLSSATFASLLHQRTGTISKYLTPLEFLGYDNISSDCSIMIITAGGNNTDILSVFDRATSLGIKNIGIMCASTNNKLVKKASSLDLVHSIDIPTGKDGFLATNSLIASMVWLCRAYMKTHMWPFKMPQLDELCGEWKPEDLERRLTDIISRNTIVCLYDNWGKTAAVDLESKLVEAGLCSVQLADYRNFAHGRHNWLDKNRNETSVVAFVNPNCRKLASKTLALIPEYMPQARFDTGYEGPAASIALIIQVLHAVNLFGTAKGIDPGKPHVARFGRKIYHLTMPRAVPDAWCSVEKMAICRKFGHANPDVSETKTRLKLFRKFAKNISGQKFGAVVFDYDGTVCDSKHRSDYPSKEIGSLITTLLSNNIVIGIATGRGRSVRKVLQKIIPRKWQSGVHIGYYNGGIIRGLSDDFTLDDDETIDEALMGFMSHLDYRTVLDDCTIERRPKQISIQTNDHLPSDLAHTLYMIAKEHKNVKIVESIHSVDIIPCQVSKLSLVDHIQRKLPQQLQVLCVGDKGEYPGNDFELLSTKFSLSVGETSNNPDSCWNTLPYGLYGESGVLEYFKNAVLYDGYLTLNVAGGTK